MGVGAWHSYGLWGCVFLPRSWGSPLCSPLETSHHAYCTSKCARLFGCCSVCLPCFAFVFGCVCQQPRGQTRLKISLYDTNLWYSIPTTRQDALVTEVSIFSSVEIFMEKSPKFYITWLNPLNHEWKGRMMECKQHLGLVTDQLNNFYADLLRAASINWLAVNIIIITH